MTIQKICQLTAILTFTLASVMGNTRIAFAANSPGYLYNMGSHVFLRWSRSPYDKYMWVKGTKDANKAGLFKIQKAKYHSATYSLIMSADSRVVNAAKKKNTQNIDFPFYGTPSIGLIGEAPYVHIGMTTDTSDPNSWFSFSPPQTKKNFFKIYLKNKCLTVEGSGYAKLDDCVAAPAEKHAQQLFKWFAENEHVVITKKTIRQAKLEKLPAPPKKVKAYTPDSRLFYDKNKKKNSQSPDKKYAVNHPAPISNSEVPAAVVAINNNSVVEIAKKPAGYYDEPDNDTIEEKRRKLLNADEASSNAKVARKGTITDELMPPGF
ncbi:hypothetical protein NEAUS04_0448 [Nematocida ausubeli]|nr:hypothetical protein NEAUS07_0178 [Nematocida ausubeli]KAI5147055.1 hypothetical protein NEAUS05_0386 [Nematocida ausubeli]KAI5161334.1 hypothetical protein NEAUS04_0448 [Nematocida ausubeli]